MTRDMTKKLYPRLNHRACSPNTTARKLQLIHQPSLKQFYEIVLRRLATAEMTVKTLTGQLALLEAKVAAIKTIAAPSVTDDTTFTIDEFCRRNHMSPSTFYALQRARKGPACMKVGRRSRISIEAEREWRRAMQVTSADLVK